jgi:predicted SAM-dependent methyltransferase
MAVSIRSSDIIEILSMELSRSAWNGLRDIRDSLRRLQTYAVKQTLHGKKLEDFCRGKSALLLNIGCGPLTKSGWVNIDYEPRNEGTFYCDVRNGLPLADRSVRHIHTEHFLSYLDYEEALSFLRECNRILDSEGTMRIVTPDVEKYVRAYAAGDSAFFGQLRHLAGAVKPLTTPAMVCNQMFRLGGAYKFSWDFETLKQAAIGCGFSQIVPSKINDAPSDLAIDGQDWWRPFESLYANLRK